MTGSTLPPISELRRMMLIINPVSGRRTSLRFLPDIIRKFNENGHIVSVFPTGKRGDAAAFAECYSSDFDIVVCIGGDGTLNETVRGIVKSGTHIPLGYIPSGSTNDFAACHGLSADMLTAASNIVTGKPKKIDIGKSGDEYFCYVAAFGAFSWLSYTTPQNLKNVLGHSAYILDAVKDLPKIRAHHLSFSTENAHYDGSYIFGAVCSSTSVAGTISLPHNVVDTSDGKFEVLLVRQPKTIVDFQGILSGVLTQDYSSPFLEFFQADRLVVEAPPKLDWSLDGERSRGSSHKEIINMQQELTLIC